MTTQVHSIEVERIKRHILRTIAVDGMATFASLEQDVPGFEVAEGQPAYSIKAKGHKIYHWMGLSEHGSAAIAELTQQNILAYDTIDPIYYISDGRFLRMPIITEDNFADDHKELHWLVTAIVPGPNFPAGDDQ